MPLIAKHMVDGGPLTFGLLLGAFGAGAVAGALGSAHVRRLLSTETIVWAASVSFAIAAAISASEQSPGNHDDSDAGGRCGLGTGTGNV